MYPNFRNNREALGFTLVKDKQCGERLIQATNELTFKLGFLGTMLSAFVSGTGPLHSAIGSLPPLPKLPEIHREKSLRSNDNIVEQTTIGSQQIITTISPKNILSFYFVDNTRFPLDSAIAVELAKRVRGGDGSGFGLLFLALLAIFMYTNGFSFSAPAYGPMPAPEQFPNLNPFQPSSPRPGSQPSSLRPASVRYAPVGPTIVNAHPIHEISITSPPEETPYLEPDKPDLAGPPQFGAHTKPPQIKQENWSPLPKSEKRKTGDIRDFIIYSP